MAIQTNNSTAGGIFYPAVSRLNNPAALTIAAWVRPFGLGGTNLGRVVGRENASNAGWSLAMASNGGFQFQTTTTGTPSLFAVSGSLLSVGAGAPWQHIAITWDGSLFAAGIDHYLEGVLTTKGSVSNGGGTRLDDSAFPFSIGNRATGSRQWNGQIAELGIWSVRLPARDILGLARGMSCRAVAPHAALWTAPLVRSFQPTEVLVAPTSQSGITVVRHPRSFAR
jgi:hypothetical protein